MGNSREDRRGFSVWSLTEILFVAVLFAVAVAVVVPLYSNFSSRSDGTRVLRQARQIHLAIAEYAIDEDGLFPTALSDSNSAYRQLFDRKFQDERIFYVPGSAWHDSLPEGQTKPDNDVGDPPEYLNGLTRGENHFAYVDGLNNGSKGNLPLVADGFTMVPGVYSDDPDERGGVWEGEYATIVRVDGSARREKQDRDGRIYETRDGRKVDLFSKEGLGAGVAVLNPTP